MPICRLPEDLYPSDHLDATPKPPHRHGRRGRSGDGCGVGVGVSTIGIFSASGIRWRDIFKDHIRALDAFDGATQHVLVALERNPSHATPESTRERFLSVWIPSASHASRCAATGQSSIIPIRHLPFVIFFWRSSASPILDLSSIHVRTPTDLGTPHSSRATPAGKRGRKPTYE